MACAPSGYIEGSRTNRFRGPSASWRKKKPVCIPTLNHPISGRLRRSAPSIGKLRTLACHDSSSRSHRSTGGRTLRSITRLCSSANELCSLRIVGSRPGPCRPPARSRAPQAVIAAELSRAHGSQELATGGQEAQVGGVGSGARRGLSIFAPEGRLSRQGPEAHDAQRRPSPSAQSVCSWEEVDLRPRATALHVQGSLQLVG